MPSTILELSVRNHPGVMSHITGLFARRAFNLDAILCIPEGDGSTSRMLLQVCQDAKLKQIILQLEKLQDVIRVRQRTDLSDALFPELKKLF